MARKPNYDFEKRRKELDRKAKKDAKAAERQQRRDEKRDDPNAIPGLADASELAELMGIDPAEQAPDESDAPADKPAT